MSMTDRIVPLCELLLGAAYADKELRDQEKDKVRELLEGLGGDLPTEVEVKIGSFDAASFDMAKAVAPFKEDSEDDRKKLLDLVAAVHDADEELDFAEDDFLRALAEALALPASALEGLAVEVETEELKETFAKVRQAPPPPPPPSKAKNKTDDKFDKDVDVDVD